MKQFAGDNVSQPLALGTPSIADPGELITIPILFIALLGRHGVKAPIHQHQHLPDVWYFRFGQRGLLELDVAGRRRWRHAPELLRERVDPLVDAAVTLWAAYAGGSAEEGLQKASEISAAR